MEVIISNVATKENHKHPIELISIRHKTHSCAFKMALAFGTKLIQKEKIENQSAA